MFNNNQATLLSSWSILVNDWRITGNRPKPTSEIMIADEYRYQGWQIKEHRGHYHKLKTDPTRQNPQGNIKQTVEKSVMELRAPQYKHINIVYLLTWYTVGGIAPFLWLFAVFICLTQYLRCLKVASNLPCSQEHDLERNPLTLDPENCHCSISHYAGQFCGLVQSVWPCI